MQNVSTLMRVAVVGALWVGVTTGSSLAAPVVVNPWNTSGNGNVTGDNFGSVPNLDLIYRSKPTMGTGGYTDQLRVWALGFSDLHGISYATDTYGDVYVKPDDGWTQGVSLFSFELGVYDYATTSRNVQVQIWNGDYTSLLADQTINIGATHHTFQANLYSANGLHIQFGPYPGYVGIDNISVEAGHTVPEPAAASLAMISLCGGLLSRPRHRKSLR